MKKISFLLLSLFAFVSPVFADTGLNLEQFLRGYFSIVTSSVSLPESWSSIALKYPNIQLKSQLYPLMQKAVYLDIFPNAKMVLPLSKSITTQQASKIIQRAFPDVKSGSSDVLTMDWLIGAMSQIDLSTKTYRYQDDLTTSKIYKDILNRLSSTYYYQTGISQTGLIYGAIQGLVNSLNDPYTSFFPPTDAGQFEDQLEGEYVGIGAYVEMNQPGIFTISATMDNSPAQKAGLQAGDQIIKVDDHEITDKISVSQAVSWVKGKENSIVKITYLRNGKESIVNVIRKKVVVPNLQYSVYTGSKQPICVLTLRMFPIGISSSFERALGAFEKSGCDKYIFDLRNNPGGSLEEVSTMLNYFVPTEDPVVTVKTRTRSQSLLSEDTTYSKLLNKTVRVLVNGGSASASEIFAGVVREYVPNSLLIGTKTYGKGSVQDLVSYEDGSLFKYTMAKWYTGKKDINIDKVGFSPDVEVEDKVSTGSDAVLDWALKN